MANPPPAKMVEPISEEARTHSLRETLARAPDPGCIRVFGYASLMWNPCFEFVEAKKGCLAGYRRGCSIWSLFARGTPENPGLAFALEERAGENCEGVVFTLPETVCENDLQPLWEREMWTNAYTSEWVNVDVDGTDVCALTFVIRFDHPQFAGDMTIEEQAGYIATAAGKYGPCDEYLAQTVEALRTHDVHDPHLVRLLAQVGALKG
tara:strand:+ start:6170 stop:6793 length:624 start_codon:yes stop_codon:yes gene_type:complete